jgi:formylglycine-generating enzyme required for sulfatase activity
MPNHKRLIVLPTPVEIPAIKQPAPARSLSRYHYLLVLLVALGLFGFGVFMWGQNAPQQIEITENSQWVPVYQQHADIPMVYVPAGCFAMGYLHGEASEKPVQRMCLEGFWLAETETTIGQYGEIPIESCNIDQITKEELVNDPTPNNPMNCVTWEEAHNFCVARGMRLPTEVEWEYASRGPSNWLYPWGNDPESTYTIVRIDPNAPRPVMPVGSMSRDTSWVGAKDMAGSIREFTSTIHNQAMGTNTPFEMPYNPDDGRESLENIGTWVDWSGTTRVVKGGNFDLPIANARASLRYDEFFDFRFNHYGFRCAMDA